MDVIKNIFTCFLKLIYVVFCVCISVFIEVFTAEVILLSIVIHEFDIQILLYVLFAIFIVAAFWLLLFLKLKFLYKVFIFLPLFFIAINFLQITDKIPSVNKINEINFCIDKGSAWDDNTNKCKIEK